MAAVRDCTPDELDQIAAFATSLAQTAREALDLGLGDNSSWEMLSTYAFDAAPHFITVAEMRDMCERATALVLSEARKAGHPNVL
ncbi:MAG: hypothetical protein QM323_04155 [Acidobacteriota bacterium]|nr:hypothetical protein [Acidobacteriota bacterium]